MTASEPDAVDLFLGLAAAHPSRVAVRSGRSCVSYGELKSLALRLAAVLAAHEAPRVLIALPRGETAYASMFAAGLAGGFYTPANVASPPDKLRRIVRLLDPHFIVAAQALATALSEAAPSAQIVDPGLLEAGGDWNGCRKRHQIAYVMFTSGSTGEPKGVVVPRAGLNHYVGWIHRSGTIGPQDVVSQFNNLAFDVSVLDIYGALCVGATVIPINGRGDRLMPARVIAREGITVWTSVPSAIDLMRTARQLTASNLRTVRLFTLAGEPLTRGHLDAIFAVCAAATVQNAYGPTEATVTVTQMAITQGHNEHACRGDAVSIGPAIPGMTISLEGGSHADEGEIVIAGPQVALGYWNDPTRTAAAFRALPQGDRERRFYYTGDWAERHGGRLFFRGRVDAQVKIRGYRIELEEIAAAVRACGWPAVCVFKRGDDLVALVECPLDRRFDAMSLRAALAEHIEAYAVPAHLAATPFLPRNENDKIDSRRAAELYDGRGT